jgi:uncharacterized protein DUF4850
VKAKLRKQPPALLILLAGIWISIIFASLSSRASSEKRSAVTLTVYALPTSDGASGKTGAFADRYPKTIEIKDSALFTGRIAAYGAAYRVWIAPKGWTGSADVGGDGSTVVKLHPVRGSSASGPRFYYQDTGGCAGCALSDAAPYFPSAMQKWEEMFGYETPEKLPRGIRLVRLSSTLVSYSLPKREGLLGRGAAYFIPPNEYFFAARGDFVLPRTGEKLLDFLVRTLIRQQNWK